jgi:hypothetical protein
VKERPRRGLQKRPYRCTPAVERAAELSRKAFRGRPGNTVRLLTSQVLGNEQYAQDRIGVHAVTLASGDSKAATFDLLAFCGAMIAAVRKWYEEHQNDEKVIANMAALIRYCPKGLSPFFVGLPIVASGT